MSSDINYISHFFEEAKGEKNKQRLHHAGSLAGAVGDMNGVRRCRGHHPYTLSIPTTCLISTSHLAFFFITHHR